ncbi:hypothetical protein M595_1249 [Lyngbya aestuarii BL J]|uniref:Uncharacterized protein n=1 Tax=Lyngbya aestuarii BL J TaxID=1348334 RepID=U7QLC4_9CYAN|nr:hypothetical protein M595_1249 [Lyngbya aestuarii BL J]
MQLFKCFCKTCIEMMVEETLRDRKSNIIELTSSDFYLY